MEYEITHQEINKTEAKLGGLPLVIGLLSGALFSDNLSLAEILMMSVSCGVFSFTDDLSYAQNSPEKYALGHIIGRTSRYLIEHPEVIGQVMYNISQTY